MISVISLFSDAGAKCFDERQLQPLGENIPGDAAQLPADILPVAPIDEENATSSPSLRSARV